MSNTDNIVLEKRGFYKRLRILGYSSYDEYLASEHWKNKKKEYAESDRPKVCLVCSNPKYDLHHRSYVRLGDESIWDLLPLCREHHKGVHERLEKNNLRLSQTLTALKIMTGISIKELNAVCNPKQTIGFKDATRIDVGKVKYLNESLKKAQKENRELKKKIQRLEFIIKNHYEKINTGTS